jgi:serine/threonine protein kinase
MTLAPDTLVQNRYRVVRQIGQGNMGAVYEAVDERLSHTVALKQMLTSGEHFNQAFEREAKLLADLRHPVLPRVIDYFSDTSGQYMVMDFIVGDDLWTMLKQRNRPFLVEAVLTWADQVLHALEYMHRQTPPVIHRDIKPQNLKLTAEGQVVLLDFGLAKGWARLRARDYQRPTARARLSMLAKADESQPAHNFNTDIFGFTRQYAPLEQIQGTGTDVRSDLYAMGATLYHLLTGFPPPDTLKRINSLGYDNYSHYEAGLDTLLDYLKRNNLRSSDMHEYEHRLRENIEQARLYGDNPTSQNERADIIDQIDRVSREAMGIPFHRVCRLVIQQPAPTGPETDGGARRDPLIPLHEINSQVSREVSSIIHQALALNVDDRPATAEAMRRKLQAARHTPAYSLPAPPPAEEPPAEEPVAGEPFLPPHPVETAPPSQGKPSPVLVAIILIVLLAQMVLVTVSRCAPAPPPTPPTATPLVLLFLLLW